MSQAMTLARPYARAAFQLAQDAGTLPAWSAMLGFAAQVAAHPDVQALVGHPKVDDQALVALVQPRGDVAPVFQRFLAELAAHDRLSLLPEIAGLYEQLRAEAEQVVKATVTSAVPLDADAVASITASLRKRFGREVALETAVDPSLIGGAVVDAGDVVIDGSIRTKLARLGAALAN